MEIIRRNSDYALRSLVYMSKFPIGKKFIIEDIAKRKDIPAVFLRKIFQRLRQARIINSQRGPDGGFYLLRRAKDISLREVLTTLQGEISLSDCILRKGVCDFSSRCRIKRKLARIQERVVGLLDKYILKDM